MSKSEGNVITPQDLIERYGADILRLWTVMVDFKEDMRISEEIMTRNAEAYRKIRNTIRFVLGNLADFQPERDGVPVECIQGLDGYMLRRARVLQDRVLEGYRSYDLSAVYHRILNFCTVELSNLYLDVLKDRLYCEHPDDPNRRAAQTVLHRIGQTVLTLIAPVLSFTAEEAWQELPGTHDASVHLALFGRFDDVKEDDAADDAWRRLLQLRDVVYQELENLRQDERLGKSLEARTTISGDDRQLREDLEQTGVLLPELLIVSAVDWSSKADGQPIEAYPGLTVRTEPFAAPTCSRCWQRSEGIVDDSELPQLCPRCHDVVLRLRADGEFDPRDAVKEK